MTHDSIRLPLFPDSHDEVDDNDSPFEEVVVPTLPDDIVAGLYGGYISGENKLRQPGFECVSHSRAKEITDMAFIENEKNRFTYEKLMKLVELQLILINKTLKMEGFNNIFKEQHKLSLN